MMPLFCSVVYHGVILCECGQIAFMLAFWFIFPLSFLWVGQGGGVKAIGRRM